MPDQATKFCNAEDVKGNMASADSWSQDDALINSQIMTATAMIREYTRRDWTLGGYVDYFSTADIDVAISQGRGFVTFTLREKPVDVEEANYPIVKFNTAGNWENTQQLSLKSYSVDPRLNQIIIYPSKMRSYGRSLRVAYQAGYALDDADSELVLVPQNIRRACAIQAAFQTKQVLDGSLGAVSKKDKTGTTTFGLTQNGLLQSVVGMLRGESRTFVGA